LLFANREQSNYNQTKPLSLFTISFNKHCARLIDFQALSNNTITMLQTAAANASSTSQVISSMHQDYIHGCAFDIYGRRMATCSGDRFVRVWDLTDNGEWNLVGEWQAHRGSVSMLSWGHPEFGSLIATCGSDHEAKIFEERTNATSAASRWTAKAQLTEARKAVACVEFAPRHWGLKLATGSADGYVV
jgi:WD40 repeat protein